MPLRCGVARTETVMVEVGGPPAGEPVLELRSVSVRFPAAYGSRTVLDSVDLALGREVLGLVGESGCGKTLLGLTAMGLEPRGAHVSGEVLLHGRDLRQLSASGLRRVRGGEMAMVYQDALTSLNPGMSIGAQLSQVCASDGAYRPEELLALVELSQLRSRMKAYPHELSGGQRQRVLLAIALAQRPEVLIADEPTTALDVTVQAEVLNLLRRLRDELSFSVLLVSHDFGVMAEVADRVVVMYAGQAVELAATAELLELPAHPYTHGLVQALRSLDERRSELAQIPGVVPGPLDFPEGCRFRGRCPNESELCRQRPPLAPSSTRRDSLVACHHPVE
jgi:oligopeptide/dipeptide ABC transporter ATP-binding protein